MVTASRLSSDVPRETCSPRQINDRDSHADWQTKPQPGSVRHSTRCKTGGHDGFVAPSLRRGHRRESSWQVRACGLVQVQLTSRLRDRSTHIRSTARQGCQEELAETLHHAARIPRRHVPDGHLHPGVPSLSHACSNCASRGHGCHNLSPRRLQWTQHSLMRTHRAP